MRLSIELPADHDSAARCRQWLRDRLESEDAELRDVIVLMSSEVVTNALLHARTAVTVTLDAGERAVRVEVRDESPLLPVRHQLSTNAPMGRGLLILDILATSWGADLLPGRSGKVLWFSVDRLAGATAPWHSKAVRPATPETPPPHPSRTYRLLGVPIAAFGQCFEDHGSLVREIRLLEQTLRAADPPDGAAALPTEADALLAFLADEAAGVSFAEAWRLLATVCEQAMAQGAGREVADLDLVLSEGAGEAAARFDRFFDATGPLLGPGSRLLTPRPGPASLALRKWLVDELQRQSAGEAPRAWAYPGPSSLGEGSARDPGEASARDGDWLIECGPRPMSARDPGEASARDPGEGSARDPGEASARDPKDGLVRDPGER